MEDPLDVELDRSARRIELRNQRLGVEIEPERLELAFTTPGGLPRLTGARPRVWSEGRPCVALRPRSVDTEHVDTALGPATRVLVCCDTDAGLELGLSLDLGGDWPGVVLQLAVQNAGAAPRRIESLEVLHWRDSGGELELPGPPRARRWRDPGEHGAELARDLRLRGRLGAALAASLGAPGEAGLTLGFLGWRSLAGGIDLEARAAGPAALAVRSDAGPALLAPGERILGERLWLGLDAANEDGLAVWAARAGLELGASRHRSVSTWGSGPRASSTRIAGLARVLRERDVAVDAIRIDAGFAARPGDWLEPGEAFPGGLELLARELEALGFALGVRIAPFVVAPGSAAARAHPEWLQPRTARTAQGRLRVLDPGREPVLAWLEAQMRGLRERGVSHFWLDELRLGLPDGGAPGHVTSYRHGLEALRRGAGAQAFLCGMSAPFLASTGPLDALQLAPESWPRRRLGRSARGARASLAARAGLGGRLAAAEVASLLLDSTDEQTLRAAAIAALISGGNICLAGEPERVPEARWRMARKLIPPAALQPLRSSARPAAIRTDGADGSVLLALFEKTGSLDLSKLLPPGPVRVFDAWRGVDLGRFEAQLGASALDGAPAQLLRITPEDGSARLVGTSVHLAAGATELRSCRADPDGALHVGLALRGRHQGSVYLRLPGSRAEPVRLRIAFEDEVELEVVASLIE